jgi:hypothetical protein
MRETCPVCQSGVREPSVALGSDLVSKKPAVESYRDPL